MKRLKGKNYLNLLGMLLLILILLTACSNTWQKHYELGNKYLSEGNYEEAIIEFTAAIEIDEKNSDAFEQRGSTYLLLAEMAKADRDVFTELTKNELEQKAEADFLQAIEIGTEQENTFLRLGEFYQEKEKFDVCLEVLEKGYERTKSTEIKQFMDEVRDKKQIRETLKNSRPGDTITFGSYKGKEMEWLVLEEKKKERLLIEKHFIMKRTYCSEKEEGLAKENGKRGIPWELVAWEDCELRRWLNGDFYGRSFTASEKSFIIDSQNNNHKHPYYQNDTTDKVYILSVDEYHGYLDLFMSLYGPPSAIPGYDYSKGVLDDILEGMGEIKLRLDYADEVGPWVSFVNHYGEPDSRAVSQRGKWQIRPVIRVRF